MRNTYDAHEDVRRFAVPSRASPRGICRYVPSIWGGEPSALQFSSPLSSLPPSPRRLWKISAGFPPLYPPSEFLLPRLGESDAPHFPCWRVGASASACSSTKARSSTPCTHRFPPRSDIFLLFCEGLVFGFGVGWGLGCGELRVFCVCVGRGCERFGGCPPPAIYLGTIVLPLFRANGKGSGIRGRPHRLSRSTMATSIGRVTMRWPMAWALRWSLPPSLPSTRCKSTRATPRDGSRLLSAERWGDECPLPRRQNAWKGGRQVVGSTRVPVRHAHDQDL